MSLFFEWFTGKYAALAEASSRRTRVVTQLVWRHRRLVGILAGASLAAFSGAYALRYLHKKQKQIKEQNDQLQEREALKPSHQFKERPSLNARSFSEKDKAHVEYHDATCVHYDAIIEIDFNAKILSASVKYRLRVNRETNEVRLDMQGQKIIMCAVDENQLTYETIVLGGRDSVKRREQLIARLPGYAAAGKEFELVLKYESALEFGYSSEFYLSEPSIASTLICQQEAEGVVSFDLQLRLKKQQQQSKMSALTFADKIASYTSDGCQIVNFSLKKARRIDRFFLVAGEIIHLNDGVKSSSRIWMQKMQKGVGKGPLSVVESVINSKILKDLETSPLAVALKSKPYLQEFVVDEVVKVLICKRQVMRDSRSSITLLSEEECTDSSVVEESVYLQCVRALLQSFFGNLIDWNEVKGLLVGMAEAVVWEMLYDVHGKGEADAFWKLRGVDRGSSDSIIEFKQATKNWSVTEMIREFIGGLASEIPHSALKEIPTVVKWEEFLHAKKTKSLKKKATMKLEGENNSRSSSNNQRSSEILKQIKEGNLDKEEKVKMIKALSAREIRQVIQVLEREDNSKYGAQIDEIREIQWSV